MREEDREQIIIVSWIKNNTTLPVIHIANQRATSAFQGALLKRMGVRAGVSDLFIPRPFSIYHGLFLEIKTLKGKASPKQKEFIKDMLKEGYEAVFAYGRDDAIAIIKECYGI